MTATLAEPAPDTAWLPTPTPTPSDASGATDATVIVAVDADNASTDTGAEAVVPPVGAVADFRDPRELVIGENVRRSIDLTDHPDQVASVRQFGVQAPVLVERETDGTLHVLDGQMRVLAAIEAGCASIPVWVTEARTDLTSEQRRIDRAMRQMNLNVRRINLTDSDYAAGVAFMLDLGASATYVADGLQRARSEVRKLGAVGRSATAAQLADDNQLGLDQLAVLAEYDNLGDTDAVQRLRSVSRYQFALVAKRIAAERDYTRRQLTAALPYGLCGFGVLTDEPDTTSDQARYLPALALEATDGTPVDPDLIYTDPARWAVHLSVEDDADLVDVATGELVDPDSVDWNLTRGEPDAEPAAGLRHPDTVTRRDRWSPTFYLPVDQLDASGLRPITVRGDDPESVHAAEAEAAAREAARQARRRVIALNIRGEAANKRRLEFLSSYLQRRTPPKQAARFVAEHLARELDTSELQLVTKLLGVGGSREQLLKAIADAPVNRAWVIAFAMVIAAHETLLGKSFWRDHPATTPAYLHLLAEVGAGGDYTLDEVEQAAAGDIDYHDIDIDTAA
ncbi:ParB/RepB/Spo0J family partition protein [Nocardia cyriacigeorgica]|uniref:Putative Chromosome partitioning protein n=1 Tax=Nocardia cyriacigeorgica (strain GUH-2) TaxID=1127134 RepID=H6R950_NOCCG|nr:ParB N-terminal domain-containing protein [Nocardia cyriacigeorgica]CCF63625.1 putative Chromosome partitioning protein [Nocardia cyriacigeorgica GUH-2]